MEGMSRETVDNLGGVHTLSVILLMVVMMSGVTHCNYPMKTVVKEHEETTENCHTECH